jgi:hypothetical protein
MWFVALNLLTACLHYVTIPCHSSLLYNFSCHPSPPAIRASSLTSSCHLPSISWSTHWSHYQIHTQFCLGILFSSVLPLLGVFIVFTFSQFESPCSGSPVVVVPVVVVL